MKNKKIFYGIFVVGILIIIGVVLFVYFNKSKFLPIQMTKQNDVLYPDFGEMPPSVKPVVELPDIRKTLSIKLNKTDYQTVKLYYHNFLIGDDVIMDACDEEAVLPVRRELSLSKEENEIQKAVDEEHQSQRLNSLSEKLIEKTINLLIQGKLTKEEREKGFGTEFPIEGFKLVKTNLENGVLTLVFEDPLQKTVGGSCRVGILGAQIEKTAEQFSEVKEVKIEPVEIFEP